MDTVRTIDILRKCVLCRPKDNESVILVLEVTAYSHTDKVSNRKNVTKTQLKTYLCRNLWRLCSPQQQQEPMQNNEM